MSEHEEHIPMEETVTAGEAVKMMGISHRTLMRLIEEGKLRRVPYPRHKRVILIPIADINLWMVEAGPPRRKHEEKQGSMPALALAY